MCSFCLSFAAVLLLKLWRGHDPTYAVKLRTERLRLPGTLSQYAN